MDNRIATISLVIAIFSLVVAFLNVYWSHWRRAVFKIVVGPILNISHPEKGVSILVPVTFLNYGQKLGVVYRCAMTVNRKENTEQYYYFQWRFFHSYDKGKGMFNVDQDAAPVAVPGRSTLSRTVLFHWDKEGNDSLEFKEGLYVLSFYFWTEQNDYPSLIVQRTLNIDRERSDMLESYRSTKNSLNVDFVLDKDTENRRMTSGDVKKHLTP